MIYGSAFGWASEVQKLQRFVQPFGFGRSDGLLKYRNPKDSFGRSGGLPKFGRSGGLPKYKDSFGRSGGLPKFGQDPGIHY
ncbi:unnamed protein product [Rhizophagus irregularis]|nr:unnamed protein product [Rhizophagus irregularis]